MLELPPGFAFASYQPVAGWRIKMSQRELVQPLQIDGTDFDHEIARITWTARDEGGRDPAGRLQDFGLAVRIPDGEPGQKLTFKALQEYADGETVRWIGDHTEPDACAAGDARRRPRPRGGRDREGRRGCRSRRRPRRRASRRRGSSSPRSPRAASACCMGFTGWVVAAACAATAPQVAAVDAQDLAGHEARGVRAQEEHGPDEVLRVTPARHRRAGEDRLARAAGARSASVSGVAIQPGAIAFTRTRGAQATARERTSATIPPLLAAYAGTRGPPT